MPYNYQKIDEYITNRNFWRAKEIMQGRLAQSGYDEVLFEKYGLVLLEMGDLLEAGKYLLISGKREARYEKSINIFLQKYKNTNIQQIISVLPTAVRNSNISKWPLNFVNDLKRSGFDTSILHHVDLAKNVGKHRTYTQKIYDKIINVFFIAVFLALLVGFFTQCILGLIWLLGYLLK